MPQKSKIIYPEPAPEGIRRSRRVRVQTLESHKMERIVYDYRRRSGVHVMAIQPSNEAKYLAHSEKLAKARLKRNKLKKAKQRRQKDGRNLSMHTVLPDDLEMTFGHELPIINPETNQEVFVDCIAQQDSIVYIGPNGESPKASDPFVMCRAVNQRSFSAGEIILRGLAEKPLQRITSSTLIFRILHGKLAVTIHRKVTVLETGDTFFIPLDTTYSLRNLRNEEAKLSYVNILKIE
ncbi:centromere protein C [Patella vulgata]|uniref:centromere protein C n=1 Tax=Patella vulgata TaxID=6465 RepID=UPI0024A9659B|nr:centromere protein C [Patella vulgata]